jgi:hypothetical protein
MELTIPRFVSSFAGGPLEDLRLQPFSLSGISTIVVSASQFSLAILELRRVSLSVKRAFRRVKRFCLSAFLANSRVFCLEKEVSSGGALRSIPLPGSIEMICESCFGDGESLVLMTFAANSC